MTSTSTLTALLSPRSIAIVGVSGDPNAGPTGPNGVLHNLQRYEFPGRLFVVNPRYQEILGVRSFPSLQDIPEDIDLVVIGTRSERVPSVLRDAVKKGCRAAVIITAGFAETKTERGTALQNEIVEIAKSAGILLCGPNCLGIINVGAKVGCSATVGLSPGWPKLGGVAIVSQSGSISSSLIVKARDVGLGLSHIISCGNEAGLEVCDYVSDLADNPDVEVVVSFVEGFRDSAKLRATAQCLLRAGKPWIVYKVGRTEASAEAARGHTGAITGAFDLHRAFFRQNGIVLAEDLDDLLLYAMAFVSVGRKPISGNRVGILSCSGGSSGVLADFITGAELSLSEFSNDTNERIRSIVADWAGGFSNPIDPGPPVDQDPVAIAELLHLLDGDPKCDFLLYAMGTRGSHVGNATAQALVEVNKTSKKPLAIGWFTGAFNEEAFAILRDGGCLWSLNYQKLMLAMRAVIAYRAHRLTAIAKPAASAQISAPKQVKIPAGAKTLTEFQAKNLCRTIGLTTPKGGIARSEAEAIKIAAEIGFPVAVKINSEHIAHKTEIGGVKIRLHNANSVSGAFKDVVAAGTKAVGPANIDGAIVEEMIASSGCELLLSLITDDFYGPTIVVGLGGLWVEAFPSRVHLVLPVTPDVVRRMILESPLASFIAGKKERYQYDVEALIDAIMKVQVLTAMTDRTINELEINPLLLRPVGQGAYVLDAVASFDG